MTCCTVTRDDSHAAHFASDDPMLVEEYMSDLDATIRQARTQQRLSEPARPERIGPAAAVMHDGRQKVLRVGRRSQEHVHMLNERRHT